MTDESQTKEADRDTSQSVAPDSTLTEVWYDPTSEQELAVVIVQAIADQTDREAKPYRGLPMHDYIDIDAIETLLFGTQPNQSTGPATQTITFQYQNILVTVRADGLIQLSAVDNNCRRQS
ncbi:hypothetical protein SAMN05443574_11324 [Haloarcula vallismortis]|uniref:Halobacterial output domain-containing protein n=2 Tax=Haloarcula vallismortis TaxID=28442 RepID=M0JN99_HALVA|nr:HalOD1 output domain-containing protein [Haloarcula vallismortis]EMA09838.1 hypothetical protein C437_05045 [Haloarcula vallismortis ATCC 29715]SDX06093.1 hypothetical protein SAMN05443574_11324 [Haloarcula vallismortis]